MSSTVNVSVDSQSSIAVPCSLTTATEMKSTTVEADWSIDSWRSKPIHQQPHYDDPVALKAAVDAVRALPPLVHPSEVLSLKAQLAEVALGRRFMLQGGDCAERFVDCTVENIEAKIKILLQMSLVLTWGANMPTVKIGRVAGQYGKPRSSPSETLSDGTVVNSFKGDNVNGFDKTEEARRHDPMRLLQGHYYSAMTLNYIRAVIKGGIADLHNSRAWDLGQFRDDKKKGRYEEITQRICHSLDFMSAIGISPQHQETIKQVDYFSSHEALILEYEAACTSMAQNGQVFDLSAHFLWIGERTRQLDSAHVEFFRGISNPVGVKVGPSMTPTDIVALARALNPNNEPGKLTFITRFGQDNVRDKLPALIKAIQESGQIVVWVCDPMHGNTYTANNGLKTRAFNDILGELTTTFAVHKELGSFLGGMHFELTGEHVTECVGGPELLQDHDLLQRYTTYCDPRLNYSQSLNMSFCISDLIREHEEHLRSGRQQNILTNTPVVRGRAANNHIGHIPVLSSLTATSVVNTAPGLN